MGEVEIDLEAMCQDNLWHGGNEARGSCVGGGYNASSAVERETILKTVGQFDQGMLYLRSVGVTEVVLPAVRDLSCTLPQPPLDR